MEYEYKIVTVELPHASFGRRNVDEAEVLDTMHDLAKDALRELFDKDEKR